MCNISFKEHLPEDCHTRWPKHVGNDAVYNTKLYIFLYALFGLVYYINAVYELSLATAKVREIHLECLPVSAALVRKSFHNNSAC